MAMAGGLDAGPAASPAEAGGGTARDGSKCWVALFVVLAAGWGALFGYSATFLTEDMPFRPPTTAVVPEAPAFGFPPMPHPVGVQSVAYVPGASAASVGRPAAEPGAPAIIPAPAPAPAPRIERAEYVGTWGPNEAACGARSRRRGYIPATITPERASAGRTICSFHDGRRSGNAWVMAADCSDRGRRWSSQVRLVVDGDRLTWTSGKGSASYVRCNRRAG